MPKASPAILAFNAGELSPRLDGRTDLDKYAKGCRSLQNFLPLVQGGAMKRSGFKFMTVPGVLASTFRLLIPFQFNSSDAYVIALDTVGMFFFRNSAPVIKATATITGATQANPVVITANAHGFPNGALIEFSGVVGMTQLNGLSSFVTVTGANTFELFGIDGTGFSAYVSGGTASQYYEVAHPYSSQADVDTMQWAGQNDVLYIACATKPPMKLSRFGNIDWTLAEVEFEHFPFSPENLDEENFMGAVFTGAGGPSDGYSIISTAGEFTASMVGGYVKLREIPEAYNPEWKATTDFDQAEYTAFQANGASWENGDRCQYEGRVYELSKPGATDGFTGSVPPSHDSGYASDGRLDWEFINYGYGYGKIVTFVDAYRVDLDRIVPFPKSTTTTQRSISSISTANPAVVTMGAAHGYETGDRVFFREVTGTFGTQLNNTLRTITRLTTTTFSIQGFNGAGLAGGGGFVYRMDVAQNVNGTNAIYPSLWRWSFGAWDAVRGYPRAVVFFEDRLIWGGTSANPQTCWASRTGRYEDHAEFQEADAALVFTVSSSEPIQWLAEQNALVIGTSGDEFSSDRDAAEPLSAENVNSIRRRSRYGSRDGVPPVLADNVLLFAQRAGRKLRELAFADEVGGLAAADMTRLADHITLGLIGELAFQAEPDRLLWVVLEDGQLVCLTYEADEQVYGWHRHPIGGTSSKVISTAVIPHPDGDGDQLWAIVERTLADGVVRSIEYMEKAWTRGRDLEDAVFVDSARVYDGAPTTTISGLYRLRNQSVEVLADGVSVGPLTVSALGVVTLPTAASKVQVGFGYDAVLSPMRIEAGSADGTAQGKTKRVVSLRVRLQETGRGLYMGPTEDTATEEIPIADLELKSGDTDLLPWPGGWESDGIIVLKHNKPTPCEISSILLRMVTND